MADLKNYSHEAEKFQLTVMKKIIYILIGIFTFSVGFWIYQSNVKDHKIRPNLSIEEKKFLSLCEIAENPKQHQSKQIKVRAFLAKGGYYDVISGIVVTDYKSDCASKITVNLSDELRRSKSFLKISDQLEDNRRESQKDPRDGWAVAEVEFTGELVENIVGVYSAKPNFVVMAIEIEPIAPIKFIREREVSPWNKELTLD